MTGVRKNLVVIPSVRNPEVVSDYIKNARLHCFDLTKLVFLILTEDFVDKSLYGRALKDSGVDGYVLNQRDRDKMLEDLHLIEFQKVIPKRSHGETSFGLFFMYANKSEYENGFFIDDDTRPLDDVDYFSSHLNNLTYQGEIQSLSSSSRWVNVLHHSFHKYKLYPRGYPYGATNESITSSRVKISNIVLSQGLWINIPDLDSVRILTDGDLNGQSRTRLTSDDYGENFVAANGNYLTVCSMNLAFKHEIIPAFYQFKMDDNPWKIGRFDDIWSGIAVKKILDSFNHHIISGSPLCIHDKAPRSTFKDLRSEVPGLEANERFYKIIDEIELTDGDINSRTACIAKNLADDQDPFIRYNGLMFVKWLELLERVV